MKKLMVVFVCLLFSFAGWASEDTQENYDMPAISSIESHPISKILEDLSAYEKSNAVIDIECKEERIAHINRVCINSVSTVSTGSDLL